MNLDQPPKIFYFTNLASIYRTRLWKVLLESKHFTIYFGFGKNKRLGIKSIDITAPSFETKKDRFFKLKNIWIRKKYLIWQFGVISKCILNKPDAVIFMGDATVITYWIAAIICRIRKIRVVYHTHGLYGDESGLKLVLRKLFYKLANNFIVYERHGKELMLEEGFSEENIYVFFNSLDYPKHKSLREELKLKNTKYQFGLFEDNEKPLLIFIGRLTYEKKLHLLIDAAKNLNKTGLKVNLLIIGDGEAMIELKGMLNENEEKFINLFGPCFDEDIIGEMLYNADLCVSPGNVGLTAIHSLSFGTPVCTHNNYSNQGPEVDAITESKTGFLFKENDLTDLVNKIREWLIEHPNKNDALKEDCFEIIEKYYNPFYQEKVLDALIKGAPPAKLNLL
ncbi:MAG: glycosyltransferase [Eudoraea sp.]|nr:glycosyltransferase [Eudoraea sp.]